MTNAPAITTLSDQQTLFSDLASEPEIWRPIHYLGSKLRVLDAIREAVRQVDPSGHPLCDLFAGSGTVSFALSQSRDVTAVDIQEYSRTICAAVLTPYQFPDGYNCKLAQEFEHSEHKHQLSWAAAPMVDYESNCLQLAIQGNSAPICDLIEHGSLYAFHNNHHSLARALAKALDDTSSRLKKIGLNDHQDSLVFRYFGGIYFSYKQAVELDALLELVNRYSGQKRDSLLAAVLSTASDLVNTVGKQFAQPIRPRDKHGRPKEHLIKKIYQDRLMDGLSCFQNWLRHYSKLRLNTGQHRVFCCDFLEFLKSSSDQFGVIYADPPYTRDHYSRFYHVLETMCLRDNPRISMMKIRGEEQISRGIYRTERHQSPFCIKSQAPVAFSRLFSIVRERETPLILSYSPNSLDASGRPRVLTIDQIKEIAKKFFSTIEIESAGDVTHNKLNHTKLNAGVSKNAELLLICIP